MICIKCKNETHAEAEKCWHCGTKFYDEKGEKINVVLCSRCGGDNVYVSGEVNSSFGCLIPLIICIAAVVIGKYSSYSDGEELFSIGIFVAVISAIGGIIAKFFKTQRVYITCKDCNHVCEAEQEKAR